MLNREVRRWLDKIVERGERFEERRGNQATAE